jgi:hypothetical protein
VLSATYTQAALVVEHLHAYRLPSGRRRDMECAPRSHCTGVAVRPLLGLAIPISRLEDFAVVNVWPCKLMKWYTLSPSAFLNGWLTVLSGALASRHADPMRAASCSLGAATQIAG